MQQNPVVAYPINDLLEKRWSPRAFQPHKAITEDQVRQLFEAARWTPSSYNAQPWRYLYASNGEDDAFEALLDLLYPGNQAWARSAGMLILSMAQLTVSETERENPYAMYDLGAANLALSIQATELDLYVHQMAGFDKKLARERFRISEDFSPEVLMAVGYKGYPEQLPEPLREREQPKKNRLEQEEFVTRLAR